MTPAARRAQAWDDVVEGARAFRIWGAPPLAKAREQMRRTIVGPLLPTINRGLSFVVMGLLIRELADVGARRYLPHLLTGLAIWFLIQSVFTKCSKAMVQARDLILNSYLPASVHVYGAVWRQFIEFGFSLVLLAIPAALFWRLPGWQALLVLPGLLLIALNGLWVALLLSTVSIKYGFLNGLVRRSMRIAFLATPILWMERQFPSHQTLIQFNPFLHFVAVVREPLLGFPAPLVSWAVAVGITLAGWSIAIRVYARFRGQIPFLL